MEVTRSGAKSRTPNKTLSKSIKGSKDAGLPLKRIQQAERYSEDYSWNKYVKYRFSTTTRKHNIKRQSQERNKKS